MERDLTTSEGVDEGSAASATEVGPSGSPPTGPPSSGSPGSEQEPAPPVGEIGADGSGQELELGEG